MLLNGLMRPTVMHNAGSRLPCKLVPAGRMLTVSAAAGASSAQPQPKHHEHADTPNFPFKRPAADQPPAEYAKLRRECPVAKARLFDGSDMWLITKLKDLKEVLQDNRLSKVRTHPGFPELVPGAKAAIEGREPTFVDMDPPQHTHFRSIFEPGFSKQRVDAMKPSIKQHATELIDAMKLQRWKGGGDAVDLQENFSLPLAFKVIYQLLGIPFEDYHMLSNNVAVRASGSSTARDAAAAQEQLTRYMDKLVTEKEKNPSKDLISEVVQGHLKNGNISREQLVAHAFLLLVAGNATVASMINLGVITLLRHPEQLEAVKKDPSLWPSAVAEICRYHTASAYALRRVALQEVHVGGQSIKPGEGLIALNQSANRDEDVFPEPDRFDITRKPNPHVAYGYGTHVCPGEYLSNVELEIAFSGLFERLPGLRLAVPESQIQWSGPDKDVGVAALPVTWKMGKEEQEEMRRKAK